MKKKDWLQEEQKKSKHGNFDFTQTSKKYWREIFDTWKGNKHKEKTTTEISFTAMNIINRKNQR